MLTLTVWVALVLQGASQAQRGFVIVPLVNLQEPRPVQWAASDWRKHVTRKRSLQGGSGQSLAAIRVRRRTPRWAILHWTERS